MSNSKLTPDIKIWIKVLESLAFFVCLNEKQFGRGIDEKTILGTILLQHMPKM